MSIQVALGSIQRRQLLRKLAWSRTYGNAATLRPKLFPESSVGKPGSNIILTPGAQRVTVDVESPRAMNRAGLEGSLKGEGRWTEGPFLPFYPNTQFDSQTKKYRPRDVMHDDDIPDFANLDPQDKALAMRAFERKERRIIEKIGHAHARYWEGNLLRTFMGDDLAYSSTACPNLLVTGLSAAFNPGGLTLANSAFNVPQFISAAWHDMNVRTGGAMKQMVTSNGVTREVGIHLVLTPALARAWEANESLRGIISAGDIAAGFAMVLGQGDNVRLTEKGLVKRLMTLKGVSDVTILDDVADMSTQNAANAANGYLVGGVVGLTVMVQSPSGLVMDKLTRTVDGRATALIEQRHKVGEIGVARLKNQGTEYFMPCHIGHAVADADYIRNFYDA